MNALHALLPQGVAWSAYAQMAGIVLIGACLQGISGIGFAMFSAPIAGLFYPVMAPGPLLMLGVVVSLLSVLREFRFIDWGVAGFGIAGRLVGGMLAAVALALLPVPAMSIAFGLMLLLAIALSASGWQIVPTRRNAALAGIASGLMGTITSAGAPPFALLTQGMAAPALRATVGCILAVGGITSLALLAGVGHFGIEQLHLAVLLLPWIVLGFALSSSVGRRISAQNIRRMLLALMTLSALGILGRAALA